MKIDKINGDLAFNDENHLYFNTKYPERKYTSVTTLIGKYHEHFDEDFWTSYKAMESLMDEEFITSGLKAELLKRKKWDHDYLHTFDIDEDEFIKAKLALIDQYAKTRDEACVRGTNYHNAQENKFYEKQDHSLLEYNFNLPLPGSFVCEKHNFDLNRENAILPEYLVYFSTEDAILNIAGQIDVLIKQGNDIYILDYKTNAKGIDTKGYYNPKTKRTKKMLFPINDIDDCKLEHYTLQLSLYAYMLQRINPNFNIKLLRILHVDGDGKETQMDLEYRKDDVIKMLKDYKKKLKVEHYRNTGKFLD